MGAAKKVADARLLKGLMPLDGLSPSNFDELSKKTLIERVPAGRYVFRAGDRDNQSVYLLEGEISLMNGQQAAGMISAGTDAARHPLAHRQPRQLSARAHSSVLVARIDSNLLDILLTCDQNAGYEVLDIGAQQGEDWMTRLLQSEAFQQLPPANIQQVLMRIQEVPVRAGEVVIQQGAEGDYFYVIKSGRCVVSRRPAEDAPEQVLAELADGDAFGEEALLSEARRNASVTMTRHGSLLRLAKQDFVELLKAPVVSELGYREALELAATGAQWLDVRLPGEYANGHLQDSRNLPLSELRDAAAELDPELTYLLCCDTGRRSASGAFVLSQLGFDVHNLSDGLQALPEGVVALQTAREEPGADIPASQAISPRAEVIQLKRDKSGDPPARHAAGEVPIQDHQGSPRIEELTAQLQAMRERYQEERGRWETFRQRATEKVKSAEAGAQAAQQARDASLSRIDELQGRLDSGAEELERLRHQLQQVEHDYQQLNAAGQARDSAYQQAQARHEAQSQASLRALEQDLSAARDSLQHTETARDEALAQAADLTARLEVLQQELNSARDDLAQGQQDRAVLQQSLQDALAASERTQAELKAERVRARDRLDALQETHAGLQAQTAAAQQAHEALSTERQALQVQVAELQQTQQALADELKAARADGERMQAHENDLQRALEEAREQSASVAKERDGLQARLRSLDMERKDLSSNLAQLEAANRRLEAHHQGTESELLMALDTAREELGAAEARLSDQVREDAQARANLEAALEAARDELLHARDEALAQADVHAQALAAMQDQLAELDARHEKELALRASLESRQAQQADQGRELAGRLQSLQVELRNAQAERDTALETARRTGAEFDLMQTRQNEARARLHDMQQAIEVLQQQLTDEQATRDRLEAARQALQAELTQTQGRLETLEAAYIQERASLEAERTAQETAFARREAALTEELHGLTQTNRERELTLNRLREGLTESQQAQAARVAELEHELAHARENSRRNEAKLETLRAQLLEAQSSVEVMTEHEALLSDARRLAEEEVLRQQQAQDELRAQLAAAPDEQQLTALRAQLAAQGQALEQAGHERDALQLSLQQAGEDTRAAREEITRLQQTLEALREQRPTAEHETELTQLRETLAQQQHALQQADRQREALQQALDQSEEAGEAARAAQSEAETRLAAQAEMLAQEQSRATTLTESTAALKDALQQAQQRETQAGEQLKLTESARDEAQRGLQAAARRLEETAAQRDQAQSECATLAQQLELARRPQPAAATRAPVITASEMPSPPGAWPGSRPDFAGWSQADAEPTVPARRRWTWTLGGSLAGLLAGAVLSALLVPQPDGGLRHGTSPSAEEMTADAPPAVQTNEASLARVRGKVQGEFTRLRQIFEETPGDADAPKGAAAPAERAPVQAEAEDAAASAAPMRPGKVFQDRLATGRMAPLMVRLPAGHFDMGSGEASLNFDERPPHPVTVAAVAISKYEVSFADYDHFARLTRRPLPDDNGWGRGNRPVINVSWEEARAYTRWLSQQTGHRYRLPSEAEWEYAARAGTTGRFWWGDDRPQANCFNCGSDWDGAKTAPVGSFAANPAGLHDVSGNVAEWVEDCESADYSQAAADAQAYTEPGCRRHIARGGSYTSPRNAVRSAKRTRYDTGARLDVLGFRVAREL